MRSPITLSLLFTLLLSVTDCKTSVNPVTGRRQIVLMTEADEREIDAAVVPQIERGPGLVNDPDLTAYVDALGQALAVHSPRQDVLYTFAIIEADEPNAFALPGGHIYVSRGLLLIANSEAEVSNVLGHEIGHVAARHAAQQDAHSKTFGLSTALGDIMSGGAAELPESERISGNFAARYARNQEREADRIGQDLAIKAGIDPAGMAQFLQTLQNMEKFDTGYASPQTYFATHPALAERVAEATTNAQLREWRAQIEHKHATRRSDLGGPSSRDKYLDHLEGTVVGRPVSEGVFEGDRFIHPGLNFSLRFPRDWSQMNESSQVAAVAPTRDGVVLLRLHSEGDDPVTAARRFAREQGLRLENTSALKIGGLPAFRAEAEVQTSFGELDAELTWIAHENRVYFLIAGIKPGSTRKYQGLFRHFSHSFRPLEGGERARLTELRVRTTTARFEESIAKLNERTKNEWNVTHTAIVNGIFADDVLKEGQRIKIAVREPFEPQSRAARPTEGGRSQ